MHKQRHAHGDDADQSGSPGEDHIHMALVFRPRRPASPQPPRPLPHIPAAAQNQEAAAADEAVSENDMQISQEHSEVPTAPMASLENVNLQGSSNESPALEPILPLPPASGVALTRPPCYGWISDSETESESDAGEMLSGIPQEVNVNGPNPGESLPIKAKRASRWDVRPIDW